MLLRNVSLSIFSAGRKFMSARKISFMTLRKITMASLAGSALVVTTPCASASVINFHNANQGYAFYGGYNRLMYGQGAAVDPGNNVWNGFGKYGGGFGFPGGTAFYGGGNPDSAHGSVPAGLPGNPYAWYNGTSSTGNTLFSPTNSGAANVGNANSDGTISPVTLSLSYAFDNGSQGNVTQGTPSQVLSEAALVQGSTLGTFTLGNVAAGTYDLFLYGANYDGTRGAAFTVASGTALDGFTSTMNTNATAGNGPLTTFVLGVDYVEFIGVTPDSNGNITGTWGAVSNTISGLSGEGDFNGLQLVSVPAAVTAVPEPASLISSFVGMGCLTLLGLRRLRAKIAPCVS